MKTIEEKAKAYNKAFKEASVAHKDEDRHLKATLERIFPELAESEDEDEKIRKRLITDFGTIGKKEWGGLEVKDILAWLERQGEHANFRNKIQVGDKVTRNEDGYLVNLSQLNRVAKAEERQGEQNFEMKSAEESIGISSYEYNKIVDECIFGEQKPEENKGNIGGISANSEWSEEDEHRIKDTIYFLDTAKKHYASTEELDACIDWLKSLRQRIQKGE